MLLPINNICHSMANGPGYRLVIWTQGCSLHCPNCFNPATHSMNGGKSYDVTALAKQINNDTQIEGITISGGEPLLHTNPLTELLRLIKPSLTRILYSGYCLNEAMTRDNFKQLLKLVDLAIMGPYNQRLQHPYLGKEFVMTTNRIDINYFKPQFIIEYAASEHQVTKTGIFISA